MNLPFRAYLLSLLLSVLHVPTFSQGNSDSLFIAKSNVAGSKMYLSNPDSAIATVNKAMALAEKKGLKYQLGFSYIVLAKAHWAKTNYKLSTQFAFKALKIYENSSRTFHWGECLVSLGRTFIDLKNYDQGSIYLEAAREIARKNNDSRLLAEVVREKSFLKLELKKYDSALIFTNQAIGLYETYEDTVNIGVMFNRKARIYFELKKFDESLLFANKAMKTDSLMHNMRGLGVSYFQAAQVEVERNHLPEALRLLARSIQIGAGINNLPNLIKAHTLMAKIYTRLKIPEKVITELTQIALYKDSLYSIEKSGQIEEMKSIYEIESMDKAIKLLENENKLERQKAVDQQIISGSFAVFILLLLLLLYVTWRRRKFERKMNFALAEKNKEIELKNEEIQSQADMLNNINQLKSKLLSVISHDLRNPINNLQMLLELATKEQVTVHEFKQLSVNLRANLNVTQRALENLLNWSLSQMEGIKTEPTDIPIAGLIEDVLKLMQETANKKGIQIRNETNAGLTVKADVNQLNLIFRNLLHNAIKFSPNETNVTIRTAIVGDFCRISIEDEGIGMTPDEINLILLSNDYFSKVGTNQEKGTGLGLLLCKDFVKRNGGELFIESKPLAGAKIIFSLPLA